MFSSSSISSDTTQLIMKAVMHDLDYDMDENDVKFLDELNQQRKIQSTCHRLSFDFSSFCFVCLFDQINVY